MKCSLRTFTQAARPLFSILDSLVPVIFCTVLQGLEGYLSFVLAERMCFGKQIDLARVVKLKSVQPVLRTWGIYMIFKCIYIAH